MFGFACSETPELMPLPIALAHRLARRLSAVRKDGTIPYLRPDGKTQVTIEYDGLRPVRLNTVVVSSQHAPDISLESLLTPDVREHVIAPELEGLGLDTDGYRLLVNPTGRFEIGGPMGDAGLTGRKIIVDTYGGYARHGGGAFSGKDPSKVDRSAAYAMRWVAKNVVAAGLAERCEAQVAYAIGKAHPVSLFVETFGTETVPVERIEKAISEVFDLRPAAIIRDLDLLRPIYQADRRVRPLRPRAARTSPGSAPTASPTSSPPPAPNPHPPGTAPRTAPRTAPSGSPPRGPPRRIAAPRIAPGGHPADRHPADRPRRTAASRPHAESRDHDLRVMIAALFARQHHDHRDLDELPPPAEVGPRVQMGSSGIGRGGHHSNTVRRVSAPPRGHPHAYRWVRVASSAADTTRTPFDGCRPRPRPPTRVQMGSEWHRARRTPLEHRSTGVGPAQGHPPAYRWVRVASSAADTTRTPFEVVGVAQARVTHVHQCLRHVGHAWRYPSNCSMGMNAHRGTGRPTMITLAAPHVVG